jgi:hypothetical protein
MGNNRVGLGVLIVAIGVILLLGKLGFFGFMIGMLWPLMLLIPGLVFHWMYFSRMAPAGVLVPGGILTTYAIVFLLCSVFSWGLMKFLWPAFPFGVAVGLYEFYMFSHEKPRGVLIASMILGGVSLIFFSMTILFTIGIYVIAALFIIIGLYLLLNRKGSSW